MSGDSTALKSVWNLKGLKSVRGNILNINDATALPSFEIPHLSLTTMEISGMGFFIGDSRVLKKLILCLPNLETLYLSQLVVQLNNIFDELKDLKRLKKLIINDINPIQSIFHNPKNVSSKTLEVLQIKNDTHYSAIMFDLPKLKKISISQSITSTQTLQSIISNSKNLEVLHIDEKSFSNVNLNCILKDLTSPKNLNTLSLTLRTFNDILKVVESFLQSTQKNPLFISLELFKCFPMDQDKKSFETNLIKLTGRPLNVGKLKLKVKFNYFSLLNSRNKQWFVEVFSNSKYTNNSFACTLE